MLINQVEEAVIDQDRQSRSYNSIFSMYAGEQVAGGNPHLGEVGGTRFFGLLMGQNQHALIAFDTLLKTLEGSATPAATILELGTSHGGMSIFLQMYSLARGIRFTTYDSPGFAPTYPQIFAALDIDYRQADVLADSSSIEGIGQAIAARGTTLVLCDNGDKAREFALYARYLKPGDIILAHDFGRDETQFQQVMHNRIWSFCEIREADIEPVCRRHHLQPFLEDILAPAAWVARRKELR